MVPSARPSVRPPSAVSSPSGVAATRSIRRPAAKTTGFSWILVPLPTRTHSHACMHAHARALLHPCAPHRTAPHRRALRCRAHARAAAHHADRRVRRGALHNCKARRPAARASQGTPASPPVQRPRRRTRCRADPSRPPPVGRGGLRNAHPAGPGAAAPRPPAALGVQAKGSAYGLGCCMFHVPCCIARCMWHVACCVV